MMIIKTEVETTVIFISSLRAGVWFLREPQLAEGSQSQEEMLTIPFTQSVGEWYLRVPAVSSSGSPGEMSTSTNHQAPERLTGGVRGCGINPVLFYYYFYISTNYNFNNSDIWCKMFNGRRTSFEPSECIPFVAEVPRQSPKVEYAQYTKNHAWMPANIIPEMDPAEEISTVSLLVQLSTTTERRCGCLLQFVFITSGCLRCPSRCTSSSWTPRCSSQTRTEGGATFGWIYKHIYLLWL